VVVDISRLELSGVKERDGDLHIGPLTTWAGLEGTALPRGLEAIAECAHGIGDVQIRNLGTIGGSIVHADPASDMPAVLLALGARLEVRSPEGNREVAIAEFLAGPFMTALGPQELVTGIAVPMPPPGSGSAYVSVEHPASGFAVAGAAALVTPDSVTVAVTGVGAAPFVLTDRDRNVREAVAGAEVYGDRFASEEYRRELAVVVAERALEAAHARAKENA
jgi:carbon-monoxide dehydrogenase medium subunit